jgi:hypothetical protein
MKIPPPPLIVRREGKHRAAAPCIKDVNFLNRAVVRESEPNDDVAAVVPNGRPNAGRFGARLSVRG